MRCHRYDCVPRITFDPEWPHFVAQCPIHLSPYLGIDAKVRLDKIDNFSQIITKLVQLVGIYEPVGVVYFVCNNIDYAEKHPGDSGGAKAYLSRRPSAAGTFVVAHHSCNDGYVRAMQALK
jgi:hypothetical protein